MVEVVAIVEGPTEQTFVRDVLAGHLSLHGVAIWAVLSGKSRKHGGVKKWESARNDIVRTLKEGRYCTTMFDFYGMPQDWPGRAQAISLPWRERSVHVEADLLADVTAQFDSGYDPRRFVPYVQLHEFEALVFADVAVLADSATAVSNRLAEALARSMQAIVDEAGDPEAIDDGYETCPSRRIMKLVPGYRKPALGPIVAQRIGLMVLREKCNHFAAWLSKLERLGSLESAPVTTPPDHRP